MFGNDKVSLSAEQSLPYHSGCTSAAEALHCSWLCAPFAHHIANSLNLQTLVTLPTVNHEVTFLMVRKGYLQVEGVIIIIGR